MQSRKQVRWIAWRRQGWIESSERPIDSDHRAAATNSSWDPHIDLVQPVGDAHQLRQVLSRDDSEVLDGQSHARSAVSEGKNAKAAVRSRNLQWNLKRRHIQQSPKRGKYLNRDTRRRESRTVLVSQAQGVKQLPEGRRARCC